MRRYPCSLVAVIVVLLALVACSGKDAAQPPPPSRITAPRVATFAIRAMIHADLQDPEHEFQQYQRVYRQGRNWIVQFSRTYLVGVTTRSGRLIVTGTRGFEHFAHRSKVARLVAYTEPARPEPPGFEFFHVRVATHSRIHLAERFPMVIASYFWRGPISGAWAADCTATVSKGGQTVFEGPPKRLPATLSEAARSRGLFVQPVPEDSVGGKASIQCVRA
jgi:hypothetical protein